MADPTFLGYFIDKGVSAAAKVVRKVINLMVYYARKEINCRNFL